METVAWLAGEKHSMHPGCASYAVTRFVSQLNDELPPENRDSALKHLLARIPGTGPAGCRNEEEYEKHEELRCLMAEDWVFTDRGPGDHGVGPDGPGSQDAPGHCPRSSPGMAEDETWQVINAVLAIMREQEREQRESGERPRTHPDPDGLPGRSGVNAARECNYMFRHSGQLHLCAWDALFKNETGRTGGGGAGARTPGGRGLAHPADHRRAAPRLRRKADFGPAAAPHTRKEEK